MAFHLRLPVYVLLEEMPYEEFVTWLAYFERRPVDWREDERTFKLLQAQGVKAKAVDIFPSLKAVYNATSSTTLEDGMVSVDNLKGSALFSKMLGAIGGESIQL